MASIAGNFFAGGAGAAVGYRRAIAVMCLGYFARRCSRPTACRASHRRARWFWLAARRLLLSGVFALFTMYLPPLFPTLLRTTGAGFCYNIGRIAAAAGTRRLRPVLEGRRLPPGAALCGRIALLAAGFALRLPERR